VTTAAKKPCKIAQEEIDAGKIQFTTTKKVAEPAAAVQEPKKEESK
jgi:DNA-directed RNA polymerase subunit K/omega